MSVANALRGEAMLLLDGVEHKLRPSFQALVAAEAELGPLFAVVERAAAGNLKLDELTALLWHCLIPHNRSITRELFSDAVVGVGLSFVTPVLRVLLTQILHGR